jgi:hypothetical protein
LALVIAIIAVLIEEVPIQMREFFFAIFGSLHKQGDFRCVHRPNSFVAFFHLAVSHPCLTSPSHLSSRKHRLSPENLPQPSRRLPSSTHSSPSSRKRVGTPGRSTTSRYPQRWQIFSPQMRSLLRRYGVWKRYSPAAPFQLQRMSADTVL